MKKHQNLFPDMRKNRHCLMEKPWLLAALIVATTMIVALLTANSLKQESGKSFVFSLASVHTRPEMEGNIGPTQLLAILHYATSKVVPQQSRAEITLSFNVLKSLAPCNFLVFGLGHDSLMWTSLNPGGTTLFLEEDPKWFHKVLKDFPHLNAHVVKYPTHLSQADKLLSSYKMEPDCMPPNAYLKGNTKCKLALSNLPDEVYEKEWDVIMIDAPRGYFAEAPGRMGAIYTAAIMSRARTRPGVTHVYLHDVDRRVEKIYAEEFLCNKYLVKGAGRLWHFEMPPVPKAPSDDTASSSFC